MSRWMDSLHNCPFDSRRCSFNKFCPSISDETISVVT
jgi:hypothetical protein